MACTPILIHCRSTALEFLPAHYPNVLLDQLVGLDHGRPQLPLALARLVAQQVLLACLPPLQLPFRRHLESLQGALVRLHLRHGPALKKRNPWPTAKGPGNAHQEEELYRKRRRGEAELTSAPAWPSSACLPSRA